MATSKTEVTPEPQTTLGADKPLNARPQAQDSVLDKLLGLLSSVRFGVTMLMVLLLCCIIGMIIMQVEVEGFQDYYLKLTPAQRLVYGTLGFFDIYHAWYFTLLLAVTGLNIILASIDRFPTAWAYFAKPKLNASPNFIRAQMFSHETSFASDAKTVSEKVKSDWRRLGFRARVSEENNRITVFAQRNVWNRFGAYVVHVALLTIFIGGFLTTRYGVGGMMELRPGAQSDIFNTFKMTLDGQVRERAKLPFQIECTDLQQKLIRPEGGLDATNTIDWLSYIKIRDGAHEENALVQLNYPHDYKGYRFFQSQFTAVGNAREITLRLEPVAGGEAKEVVIPRDGTVDVSGIGKITYKAFYPDFVLTEQGHTTATGEYNNPAAELEVITGEGRPQAALAFGPQMAEDLYRASQAEAAKEGANPLLINNHKVILKSFEKVALGHTLTIQYDPGRLPFYLGSTLLVIALCSVFFFSHQRIWAVIEPDGARSNVYFGGNTNRNRPAFEARFNSLVQSVTGGGKDE